jgi:2-polyprenyl-6-methoxyphenol hydroxylase-like FAD-dependent oxidoreductase
MDVLWFRLPRTANDPAGLDMRIGPGGLLLNIDRGEYYQMAFLIGKGGHDAVTAGGLPAFRRRVLELGPFLGDRVELITSFDDVKVLTVRVNRLRRWYAPGVLLIGDAAHAMSPIGGVGINLAIADAVATARILLPELQKPGQPSVRSLGRIQARRSMPTVTIQLMQRMLARTFVRRVLDEQTPVRPPFALRAMRQVPVLQAIPARMVGFGVRREPLP